MKKRIFCLILVAVLAASALSVFAACDSNKVELPEENNAINEGNNESLMFASRENQSMTIRKVESRATSTGITHTVTASIKPADSSNQKVDWKLVWADDNTAVTSCVTLNIPSDGSLTVTLTCTEAFPNKVMKLICTSRDSGVSAFVFVRCEGIPSSMTVDGGTTVDVYWNKSQSYDIELANLIDYVGDSYYDALKVESITLNGTVDFYEWIWVNKFGVSTDLIVEGNFLHSGNHYSKKMSDAFPNALTATVSNRKLTLSLMAYFEVDCDTSTGTACPDGSESGYGTRFSNVYLAPQNASADIVLTSGSVSQTIHVNFITGVTSVSFDTDSIIF